MKKIDKLLACYAQPETVVVVSPYPKRGEIYSKGITGVASYSKNVVKNIPKKVVVLADSFMKGTAVYEEDNALVRRVWQKDSWKMWRDIYMALVDMPQVRKVLIHFDFSMYGNILITSLLLPFLFLLKLRGYETSVVAHHVILDVKKLSGHLGLGKGVLDIMKASLYTIVFHLFYFLLGRFADKIIVLEEILQNKLNQVVNPRKVFTIPHAIDTSAVGLSKKEARKALGIKQAEQVVLFFGFVNWFKGADFFVDSFKNVSKLLDKPARFILAGGKSPTMSDKAYYNTYFQSIMDDIASSKNVEITGYVPQEKISLYFSAADLIVFPYRDLMCASGVLSLAFSYNKPFIISEELKSILDEKEMKLALQQVNLSKNDLLFKLDAGDLINQTTNVLANGIKSKTVAFTKLINQQKSFAKTGILYDKVLFDESLEKPIVTSLSYVK